MRLHPPRSVDVRRAGPRDGILDASHHVFCWTEFAAQECGARRPAAPLMSWFLRLSLRMAGLGVLMMFVEFLSYLLYRELGVTRLYWYPVSYGLVAVAGYDTVRRLPLVWGAMAGAVLAGVTSLFSWPLGSLVLNGALRFPDEADPLIVATGVLIAAIVGAIVAVSAGLIARDRRRHRSRRSATARLAYTAFDEPRDPVDEVRPSIAMPMADRSERP